MSYQYRSPLEAIMRGLQIRGMIEDIKARREARAQAAQLHQLEIEQHQRNAAADQFKMQMALSQMGALPAQAGDTGANDAAISEAIGGISPENRRPFAQTPIGAYRLPSRMDVARTKGATTAAEAEAEDPTVALPIPEELQPYAGAATQKVPGSKRVDYAIKIAGAIQKQLPNRKVESTTNKETGDVTVWSYDPQDPSDTRIERVLPKIAGAATAAGGLTPHQQFVESHTLRQEETARNKQISDDVAKVQELIDKATANDTSLQQDAKEAEDPQTGPHWKAARIAAERIAKKYNGRVQAGVDKETGYPWIKEIEPTAEAGPASASPAPPKAPPKVGDVRTVRGKRMTITKVYPDGSFDAK